MWLHVALVVVFALIFAFRTARTLLRYTAEARDRP